MSAGMMLAARMGSSYGPDVRLPLFHMNCRLVPRLLGPVTQD